MITFETLDCLWELIADALWVAVFGLFGLYFSADGNIRRI